MPIINVKDNENNRWKRTAKTKQTNKKIKKQNKGGGSYSKSVRDKWFCWGFKLGFLQSIYKVSLIIKSNLELP